ncbi:MAG: hypothetical protein AB7P04_12770 [Bacteriovoracia bacterium]
MKKLGLLLALVVGAQTAQAANLEVVPQKVQPKREVIAIAKRTADGQTRMGLIISGKTAQALGEAAGVTVRAGKEMIIATGDDVFHFVSRFLQANLEAGKTVIIASKELTREAGVFLYDGLRFGVSTLSNHALATAEMLSQSARDILHDLWDVIRMGCVFIEEGTVHVVRTVSKIFQHVADDFCHLLEIFRITRC